MSESIYLYNKIGSDINNLSNIFNIIDNNYIFLLFILFAGYWFSRIAHLYMPNWLNWANSPQNINKLKLIYSRGARHHFYDHLFLIILSLPLYFIGNYKSIFNIDPNNISFNIPFIIFPFFFGTIYFIGFLRSNSKTLSYINKYFGQNGYIYRNNLLTKPYYNGLLLLLFIFALFIIILFILNYKYKKTMFIQNDNQFIFSIILLFGFIFVPIFLNENNISGVQFWFVSYILLLLLQNNNPFSITIISILLAIFIYGFSQFRGRILHINDSDIQTDLP